MYGKYLVLSSTKIWLLLESERTLADMPSKAISASQAVARLLRERRRALHLTLRAVSAMSSDGGKPIPHSTLARIEGGKLDPGVRRLQQLLRLYRLPAQVAGDLLDLEALAAPRPGERDPAKLRDLAIAAWQDGRIDDALACFLAFRERVAASGDDRRMRQEAALSFAVAASGVGKHHLSRRLLDDLLVDRPDPALLVAILVQQSVVWLSLGSPEASLAFLDRACLHVRRGDSRHAAWVDHQRALVHIHVGELTEAGHRLQRALRGYRRARSARDEALVLISIARLAFERGEGPRGVAAARRAARYAQQHGFSRLRVFALLEQSRALRLSGAVQEARELLRSILADPTSADDHVVRFHAHYNFWKLEIAGGDASRAEVELREAAYFARFVDDATAEASDVKRQGL